MQKLVIKPFGGLGNRLLVLDSCLKILRNISPLKTIVIWERNDNFFCKFSDIFELPERLIFKETLGFNKLYPKSFFQIYNSFHPSHYRWDWFNRLFGRDRFYEHSIYSEEIDIVLKRRKSFIPPNGESVYLSFYQRFYDDGSRFYDFRPTERLRQKINEVTCQYQSDTIGIHIRRTDHSNAIVNSPIASFVTEIEKYIEVTDGFLFLSTDDPTVKKFISKRYGHRIITRDISYSRSEKKGIEDAVIDLFCLSQTREIWGSYESTFSEVASMINESKMKIIK